MTQVNYAGMTDQELKRYILTHPQDQAAFYVFMDRRYARPRKAAIRLDDPQWTEKVMAAIRDQIEQHNRANVLPRSSDESS